MNGVVTELSCSSNICVPQTVQYHCETNTTTLAWQNGTTALGGFNHVNKLPTMKGYNITIVHKDGGGISSNISFMADGNNGTTIHCVDFTAGGDNTYNCTLIYKIGMFNFEPLFLNIELVLLVNYL